MLLKHVEGTHHPFMLGDNLLSSGQSLDLLDVSLHQAFDLAPFQSHLIRGAIRMKAEGARIIRLLVALSIKQQLLPLVLPVSEDSSDECLDLARVPFNPLINAGSSLPSNTTYLKQGRCPLALKFRELSVYLGQCPQNRGCFLLFLLNRLRKFYLNFFHNRGCLRSCYLQFTVAAEKLEV